MRRGEETVEMLVVPFRKIVGPLLTVSLWHWIGTDFVR
jgi:hypothetical protein